MIRYADSCNAPHPDRWYDTMPECPALVTTPSNRHVHYCEFAPIRQAYQAAAMSDHHYPVFQVPKSGIDPEDEPERLGSIGPRRSRPRWLTSSACGAPRCSWLGLATRWALNRQPSPNRSGSGCTGTRLWPKAYRVTTEAAALVVGTTASGNPAGGRQVGGTP